MKQIALLLFCLLPAFTGTAQDLPKYPPAPHTADTEVFYGRKIPDSYRPLTEDTLTATRDWLAAEAALTDHYMKRVINRYDPEPQLRQNSISSFPATVKLGKYYFGRKSFLGEADASIYLLKRPKDDGNRIIDPATYLNGRHDRVSIGTFAVSEDNELLAFCIAHKGSDWQEIHVKKIATGRDLDEVIPDVKFSHIVWSGQGFCYMRYAYKGNNRMKDISERAAICYHRIGQPAAGDTVVYTQHADPTAHIQFNKTALGEYLIIYDRYKEAGGQVQLLVQSLALQGPAAGRVQTIIRTNEGSYGVLGLYKGRFLVQTTLDAPRGRLLLFRTDAENDAEEFIPQYKEALNSALIAGDKVICTYLNDIDYLTVVSDTAGKIVHSLQFPTGVSISDFSGSAADSMAHFSSTSFFYPAAVYEYNTRTFANRQVDITELAFSAKSFMVEKVYYTSKDGTRIPMMIACKKGLRKNGKAPAILYGYGGNGVTMTPFFNRGFISFIQNGGIIALPCIRGGDEYGEEWHSKGARGNKQKVFEDFIAAAEALFKEGYTSREKLALMGGSNGGLLVAAVINQRPDICRAVVAEKGVYDMLHFQNYTIGHAWQQEYGSVAADSTQFSYLYSYSPLHNVKKGTAYPAVLITTADNDDRVVPLHSYKYAAAMQEASTGEAPIYLMITKNAGHLSSSIEEDVRIYAFLYDQLGLSPQMVGFK